jgi:hypothetical protein
MLDDRPRQRKCRTALRKVSRHKREARIDTGKLDPELDFTCPHCGGVYSLYYGRHKLHLRACERRIAQAAKLPQKPPLPSPLPFEKEAFPTPVVTGEYHVTVLLLSLSYPFAFEIQTAGMSM